METYQNDEGHEGFYLSTGRTFHARGHTLGMDPQGGISEGWDRGLGDMAEDFTPAERLEIAHYMIDCWLRWAQEGVETKKESDSSGEDIPCLSEGSWIFLPTLGWAAVKTLSRSTETWFASCPSKFRVGKYVYSCRGVTALDATPPPWKSGTKVGLLIEGEPQS